MHDATLEMRVYKIPNASLVSTLWTMSLLFVLEWTGITLGIHEVIPMQLLAVFHIVSCLITFFWVDRCYRKNQDMRLPFLSLVTVPTLGPFAPFLLILFCINYFRRSKNTLGFAAWYATLFPETIDSDREMTYERIVSRRDDFSQKTNLVPFTDVMESGTEEQKSEAITKILKYFHPKYSQALVMGLKDTNPVIRVRSATAVARLEEDFSSERLKYEKILQEHPKDKEAMFNLASSLVRYTDLAFVDEETKKNMLEKAKKHYQDYLKYDPKDEDVLVRLGLVFFQLGDNFHAKRTFEEAIEMYGINSCALLKGYLNILFKEKNFEMIRKVCEEDYYFLESISDEAMRLNEIVQLWRFSDLGELDMEPEDEVIEVDL